MREAVEEAHGRGVRRQGQAGRGLRRLCRAETPTSTRWPPSRRELEAIIATAGTDSEHQLEIAADALRLPPWDAKIGVLSGGEKRRVALCRLLLSKPDMLLLDEPTNHLDAESVEWLEQFLQRFSGTVVAITHDRYFLDNAAEWILELDRGRGIPWKGNYSTWLEQKGERLEQEQKSEEAHAKAMKKELEWSRQNPKARQAKSKARLARFEELSDFEYQKRNETQEIFIPVAERLGNEVIEFKNVSKSFGDRLLIDNLSFKVPAGRHRRHHRPQRRRQVDAVQADRRQGKAGQRRSRRSAQTVQDGLRRPAPRRAGQRQDRVGRRLRRPRHHQRRQVPDGQPRLLRAASTSTAATSRRRSARCRAASAAACTWPRR